MSRASREAESIAKADAYFEAIRRTPEPDWPQDTQVQPSVDQNIVPAEAAQSINIVPVAVLQRGAPSWSTEKFEEEHARREQEHRAQQQVISKAYYADPLNTDNPVPEQLLFAAAPTTTPNTEPELDAFYDSPNGELGTNRQVLARLDKGQRERFDATLSALFSIDTRDTTASLPEVGALPPEPLIERGKVVGDVPQAKPQTPAVHAFQESMGQGYHFVRAAAAQEAVAPSAPEVHKPDAAASLVTRIMGAATAPNTRSDIAEPAAMAGQLEHGSEPTAEGIITELRNQQEAPGETILERVLSGL